MTSPRPYYVAGQPEAPNGELEVLDKHTGVLAARVALADADAMERAIAAAYGARDAMRRLPTHARRDALLHCVTRFEARREELAQLLCVEAGKPLRDARGEVGRLIDTFRIGAEEATRITGEVLPMDLAQRSEGYLGFTKRVPVGACALITPFNFPLNLVAHKVAPAIAAGCPFVLKPASSTPLGALVVAEVLAETSLPPGAFSVLPATRETAEQLVTDPRLAKLSFTGSAEVGWAMKARAGKKRVTLELGGNAAVIVDEDSARDAASLDDLIARLAFGAFYQSGQSCISVQRILVHARLYDVVRERLVAKARSLVAGDPKDERTTLGPVISAKEASRIRRAIDDAIARGATRLCGEADDRSSNLVAATLLEDVPRDCDVVRKEIFGPVAVLSRFDDFDAALAEVNDSDFGLQAGVFTRDLHRALRAWDVLEVGGVMIGEVPSFRVDQMPYGGVKDSGLGREGLRYAIEAMTEPRLLVIRPGPTR
jgi:acyl-CoA reductase-like NAD-dependent aldehyde dehydrogenase